MSSVVTTRLAAPRLNTTRLAGGALINMDDLAAESSSLELLNCMKKLKLFPCRVLAKDQLYDAIKKKLPLEGYNIINIDTLTSGGSHWTALYVPPQMSNKQLPQLNSQKTNPIALADSPYTPIWFCSFGGFPLQGVDDYFADGIIYYNKTQIQDLKQSSCGYFSLGALLAKSRGEFVKYCHMFGVPGQKNNIKLLKYLCE